MKEITIKKLYFVGSIAIRGACLMLSNLVDAATSQTLGAASAVT